MKLAKIFTLFSLVVFSANATARSLQKPADGQKILLCKGERKGSYDPANRFGAKIDLEVLQTPLEQDYRWILKLFGNSNFELRTNGPINEDGSTVAPNGDEGSIMFASASDGVVIKKNNESLQGLFRFIEAFEGKEQDEYYLVEYDLSCSKSGEKIDLRESLVYNTRSELADLAVSIEKPWLNGVGVQVSETGLALGVAVYARDEEQKSIFVEEFVKRGLVTKTGQSSLSYKYKRTDGNIDEVPLFVQITGDVEPIP